MAFLETSNTTMYYDIFEPGITGMPLSAQPQTVLLIHGFGGTPTSDFGAQLPALRGHYRVIAPHLHGYGRSTQRSSYALSFYRDDVADLVALLDMLEIEKVLVLGFSDGGIAGLLLAALHPQRVIALVVMGAQPTINVGKSINSPFLTHKVASHLSLIRMFVLFCSDAYLRLNSKLPHKPA